MQNINRSLKFYTEIFGLREVSRGDNQAKGAGIYVLLKDDFSGQRLELNWYPEGSTFGGDYNPGECLDHIAFRVENVQRTLDELARKGIEIVDLPSSLREPDPGVMVGYVKDPDGNWIELYHNPTPIGSEVPKGY